MEKVNITIVEKYKKLSVNQKINYKSWMGNYKRIFEFDLNYNFFVAPAILTFCVMYNGERLDVVISSSIHSLGK
jgi:hypothetical protein